jgi:hypothetical protein
MADLVTPIEGGAASQSLQSYVQKIALLNHGMRIPTPSFPGIWDGVVCSVDADAGTLMFTMPGWDGAASGVPNAPMNGQAAFGPAPYPSFLTPSVGQACVIEFAGNGIESPRVLAFLGAGPTLTPPVVLVVPDTATGQPSVVGLLMLAPGATLPTGALVPGESYDIVLGYDGDNGGLFIVGTAASAKHPFQVSDQNAYPICWAGIVGLSTAGNLTVSTPNFSDSIHWFGYSGSPASFVHRWYPAALDVGSVPNFHGNGLNMLPLAPSVVTIADGVAAGSLTPGTTYYYVVELESALGLGSNTLQSAEVSIVAPASGSIALMIPQTYGALNAHIYRTTSSGSYISPAQVAYTAFDPDASAVFSYTDIGATLGAGQPATTVPGHTAVFQSYLGQGPSDPLIEIRDGTGTGWMTIGPKGALVSASVIQSLAGLFTFTKAGYITTSDDLGVAGFLGVDTTHKLLAYDTGASMHYVQPVPVLVEGITVSGTIAYGTTHICSPAGAITMTAPAPAYPERSWTVYNTGPGNVTVAPSGGGDALQGRTLLTPGQGVTYEIGSGLVSWWPTATVG